MLRSLHIENIAVVKRADLDFDKGFSVLTGETGAGKSLIIDSINLLLGNRAQRELIRTGEDYALISAVFEELTPSVCESLSELGFPIEDGTLMLQRRLQADGKSQSRLNGQVITQGMQREITRLLISIHGQNDSQRLLQQSAHLTLVDAYAGASALLDEYQTAYRAWRSVKKQIEALTQDEAELLRRAEMLRFQLSDIDAMKLKAGEEEVLIAQRDRLLHSEHINKQIALVLRALRGGERHGAMDLLSRAEGALRSLDGIVEESGELSERLAAVISEIEDVAAVAEGYAEELPSDPTAQIDRIEGRLEGISRLKRKYGGSIEQILAFREAASEELASLESSDEIREKLEKEEKMLRKNAMAFAQTLGQARRDAAAQITRLVTEALGFLDMPKVRFEIRLTPTDLTERGMEDAEFLIATNAGEPLLPMLRIASGGELSRIMLALRSVLNDKASAHTVIFDEIDTGISGKTARKVGIKLWESAKEAQVICVTHSAQIASLADAHYRISKEERNDRAEASVALLDGEGRIEEIARILGGIEITDAQRLAARQMLEEYRM